MARFRNCWVVLVLAAALLPNGWSSGAVQAHDTVILNCRVIDPESGLDGVRNIGISGGVIRAITTRSLRGRNTIEGRGLVVAPGFIDLHSHGQDAENYAAKAMDGVTSALELEVGTADVEGWYAERQGKSLINYGVSIGHIPVRMTVMADPGSFLPSGDGAHKPASEAEVAEMRRRLELGLKQGAVAVGFGVAYTPAASRWEILEMFRVAARFSASCHVHMRFAGDMEPQNSVQALEELIAAAAITGAPLHVVHVQSSGLRATPRLLQMIGEANSRGIDVTTECYPYTAGMTAIESAIFDEGWQKVLGIDYKDLQWAETGERLSAESFARYRKEGGFVILHLLPDEIVQLAVKSPLTMIASDGGLQQGKGHPRSAGSYARILGRFVREQKSLTLMEAVRKMSLMPALRLERRTPAMKKKGRIRVGADADLVVFDPDHVIDKATYEQPARYSEGMRYLLVGGAAVVEEGRLKEGVMPGRPIRVPANR